jgi:hypothetical protein
MDLFDLLISVVLFGVPIAYLALQLRILTRWTGGFRTAALLPPALWAVWAAVFAFNVMRDPTSHNLFPFELLIGALLSLAYLGCLALVRTLVR